MFSSYNIYFDEGIKYLTVGRNVFNVVFTKKYNGSIVGDLGVLATPSEVKSALRKTSI